MSEQVLMEQLDQAIDQLIAGFEPTASVDTNLSGLLRVADRLRALPHGGFKMHLQETLLAPSTAIESITPFICVLDGAGLIEFMKNTFDAEETIRHPHGADGLMANVKVSGSDILVMGGSEMRDQEYRGVLHVYVNDCDAVYQRALKAGAVTLSGSVGEPADRPYGERAAFVSDPFGNILFIATRPNTAKVVPSLLLADAAPVIQFLKDAFGARVEGVREDGGRIKHAFVHMGKAFMEISETEGGPGPCAFYMRTDDVDALYERAVAAGGKSMVRPFNQANGDRLAIVDDAAGNRWLAAKPIA
jgi:PhnB protein